MTSTHTHTQHPPQHHGHFNHNASRRHSTTSPYTIPPKNNVYIQQQQQQYQAQQYQAHPHQASPHTAGLIPTHLSTSVPLLSRDFVVRRISEGESGRLKEELKCEACGKGYKHISSLAKHLWEHTPEWNVTKKLLISKHQQVQLLEAASILVAMNDKLPGSAATSRRNSLMPDTINEEAVEDDTPVVPKQNLTVSHAPFSAHESSTFSKYSLDRNGGVPNTEGPTIENTGPFSPNAQHEQFQLHAHSSASPPPVHDSPRGSYYSAKNTPRMNYRKSSFSQYPPRFDAATDYSSSPTTKGSDLPHHLRKLSVANTTAINGNGLNGGSYMDVPAVPNGHFHPGSLPNNEAYHLQRQLPQPPAFDFKSPSFKSKPVRVNGLMNPISDDDGREELEPTISGRRGSSSGDGSKMVHSPRESTYDDDDVFGMDA
ncbi:hypothetical protein BABINDRAFT_175878 [Babjeviella inositovora NRRL Y-12698]|uniref:C2H2-type domain-containing protein n=1 Tax=Babjeviella inositovora NRRL Y-12698 TaxID=984486 RepID=A0A1E3QRM8_9ASCO|nr:uncharacterized protein BABINDRAFT_175878 [Babjeviella inositovora NRRL Y-12698]ODQ79702.1 hypothetical protein BABINDRAFT_175878 [Babjeviella inositovora NRRL Y-12698]